jgi:tripartite-type tricarboxylate transporter receptor subunit TctC
MRVWKTAAAAMFAVVAMTSHTLAQADYPNRPITLIVPFSAGGNADNSSRLIARLLTDKLGQTVVIDNKPGANGIVGMEIAAAAKPDGYTMLFVSNGQMAIYPFLYKNRTLDPAKAFTAVRAGASNSYVLVFNPSKPYKTLPEFIEYAKKNPTSINYGSIGNGSPGHLAGELLQQLTGIKMTHVPYRLAPALSTDLLSGVLDIGFDFAAAMKPNIEAGRVIPIAAAADARIKNLPNLPTFEELGYPDMKMAAWGCFLVPAGTPDPIVQKLSAALSDALRSPTMTEFYSIGDSVLLDLSPDKFPQFLASEQAKMKALIERAGVTAD